MEISKTFVARLAHSMATNPSSLEWRMVLLGSGLMVGAFMAAAKYAGTYPWQPLRSSRTLGWAAAYMAVRAVLEETVFRALMLPHPKEGGFPQGWLGLVSAGGVPLALFVLSHLFTTQRPPGKVMKDAKFCCTIALLGLACSVAYFGTGGSLWAAVAAHWLIGFPWMVVLGGYRSTHTPTPLKREVNPAMEPSPMPFSSDTKAQ